MTKPTNILYVVDKIANVGGIEKIVIDKSNYLVNYGLNVSILVLDYEKQKIFFTLNPKVTVFTSQQQTESNLKNLKNRKKQFLQTIKTVQPDFIIFTRPFLLENALCGFLFPKIKRIVELHACYEVFNYGENYFRTFEKIQDRSFEKLSKKIFPFLHRIVPLTHRDNRLWNLPNTQVILNFTTFDAGKIILSENKTVVSVGRLDFQKGYEYLIEAWVEVHKQHPAWQLDVWGDGGEREMLQAQINRHNLTDCVHLKGFTQNMLDVYASAAFFVMSSRLEGLPLSLIEAQQCGLSIVSFDLPSGPAEIITDGKDGFLCNYLDIDDLSDKIKKLIQDENLRKQMSKNARENAKRFFPETIMQEWINLFETGKSVKISFQKTWQIRLKSLQVILHYLKSYLKIYIKTR